MFDEKVGSVGEQESIIEGEIASHVREELPRRLPRRLRNLLKPQPNRYTVLVVQAQGASQGSVAETLRSAGFRSLCATSATEALAVLVRRYVDVVVCDNELPDMQGAELTRELKRITIGPQRHQLPVVLVASGDGPGIQTALRSGADLVCLRERLATMLVAQVLFLLP